MCPGLMLSRSVKRRRSLSSSQTCPSHEEGTGMWSNWPCIIKMLCISGWGWFSYLHPSYSGPSHNWSWDRVGCRPSHHSKKEEISRFLVYPTPGNKKGNILQSPGYSGFYLSHPCSCSPLQNVTIPGSSLPLNPCHFRAWGNAVVQSASSWLDT